MSAQPSPGTAIVELAARWIRYWVGGDIVTKPETPSRRVRIAAEIFAQAVALVIAAVVIGRTVRPLTREPAPAKLVDEGDVRYGLTSEARREIFTEIASNEEQRRELGKAGFPGQPWSQDDHRAAYERDALRSLAARRGINLTQIYLVLDEGIRSKWPGPDGKPLLSPTVPLEMRIR